MPQGGKRTWRLVEDAIRARSVKHFVAKLVKSFGRLGDETESLDDFRYAKPCFQQRKMLDSVPENRSQQIALQLRILLIWTAKSIHFSTAKSQVLGSSLRCSCPPKPKRRGL